jgi:GDP-L-fucose synthase
MKKIFVTGASGFLGRHLCEELSKLGHEVFKADSKNCDLTQKNALDLFNTLKFDCIYHLAAWTQAGDFCLHHAGEQWLINQKINTHVLDWWVSKQRKAKLIAIGTSCSYDPELPLEEEFYLKGMPISSLFTYAMTKRMLLTGLMALSKQYELSYLYLIPSTLYGPCYHIDGRQLHFIFDLISKILKGHLYESPVVLWGDGEQKRELIHVQDFVKIMLLLSETKENEIFNIGGGSEYSIREYAAFICEAVGYPLKKIDFDLTKYVGARSKCLSIKKLEKEIPFFSSKPLNQGLFETISWFKEACFTVNA